VVAFAPTVASDVKFTPSAERSTLKPCSLVELSVHDRSIRLEVWGVAVRPVGGAGTGSVVAVAVPEGAESFGPS
jgi:hypothetical protein